MQPLGDERGASRQAGLVRVRRCAVGRRPLRRESGGSRQIFGPGPIRARRRMPLMTSSVTPGAAVNTFQLRGIFTGKQYGARPVPEAKEVVPGNRPIPISQ